MLLCLSDLGQGQPAPAKNADYGQLAVLRLKSPFQGLKTFIGNVKKSLTISIPTSEITRQSSLDMTWFGDNRKSGTS